MTSTISTNEVLKQDTRGRVRMPRERISALLDEFEKSGLSAAGFARMVGVKYPTFLNWVQRRRKEVAERVEAAEAEKVSAEAAGVGASSAPMVKGVRLLEAVMDHAVECGESAVKTGGLWIELPGDCRMRVDTPGQLPMAGELVAMMARNARRRC